MISREKLLGLFASLTMVACTGPVPTEGVEVDTSKIVGGTTTSGDPSVVLIFAYGTTEKSYWGWATITKKAAAQ